MRRGPNDDFRYWRLGEECGRRDQQQRAEALVYDETGAHVEPRFQDGVQVDDWRAAISGLLDDDWFPVVSNQLPIEKVVGNCLGLEEKVASKCDIVEDGLLPAFRDREGVGQICGWQV